MKLQITPGAGRVTLFNMTVDTESLTLVSDPANEHRPAVGLKEWAGDAGGTRPVETPARKDDDGQHVRR